MLCSAKPPVACVSLRPWGCPMSPGQAKGIGRRSYPFLFFDLIKTKTGYTGAKTNKQKHT